MIGHALRFEIERYADRFCKEKSAFLLAAEGRLDHAAVARYLVSLEYSVRSTPRMLALAKQRALLQGDLELAKHYTRKDEEEAGHHVWAANDIHVLKQTKGADHLGGPATAILELIAYLESAIQKDPYHYLAYMLFAEYFTVLVGGAFLQNLVERCGVPANALTCVAKHVELDAEHTEDGIEAIDRLVVDPRQLEPMRQVVRTTMQFFDRFSDEILQEPHVLRELPVAV